MKPVLFTLLAIISFECSFAQIRRNLELRAIKGDSVNFHFTKDYLLIEDACSNIIRYGHFNFQERRFVGAFRDVNRFDPQVIMAEGMYTADGKLDGSFVLRNPDNTLQARGTFKNGEMTGLWEIFYDDGKPKLILNVGEEGKVIIQQAWDGLGKKTVSNGKGHFRVDHGMLYWEGNILNGMPEGTWTAKFTTDRTGRAVSSEIFKNSQFQKGSGPLGNYSDSSRLTLISKSMLPINKAADMAATVMPCQPEVFSKKLISAIYKDGDKAYALELSRLIGPVLSTVDLREFGTKDFSIEGEINEKGSLLKLTAMNSFDDKISYSIINVLRRLPSLQPAQVDGKPVTQKISFNFRIEDGLYRSSFRILPLTLSSRLE